MTISQVSETQVSFHHLFVYPYMRLNAPKTFLALKVSLLLTNTGLLKEIVPAVTSKTHVTSLSIRDTTKSSSSYQTSKFVEILEYDQQEWITTIRTWKLTEMLHCN